MERTVGESAQLQLNASLSPGVREVEWAWDSEDGRQQLLVSWKPNGSPAEWYELDEKYKARFRLTERALLAVENLTADMSGRYTARIKFKTGHAQEESFRLCLYGKGGAGPQPAAVAAAVTDVGLTSGLKKKPSF